MSTPQNLHGTDALGQRHEYEYLGPWISPESGNRKSSQYGPLVTHKHSTGAGGFYRGFTKVRRLTDGKILRKRTDQLFLTTTAAA